MGLFFAPAARLTLGFAPRVLEGVASGASNALRQFGTVLGVAVLGSVFSAAGGYASGQSFVTGLAAAQRVGAGALAVAALLALAIPRKLSAVGRAQPVVERQTVTVPAIR
jgi:hypothetical protein